MRRIELVCEGFDDRDFIGAWLLAEGWRSLRPPRGTSPPRVGGRPVKDGAFAYQLGAESQVVVTPAHSVDRVSPVAEAFIAVATPENPLDAVVLVVDDDGAVDRMGRDIDAMIKGLRERSGGKAPPLFGWMWSDPTPPGDQLPRVQTLERVIVATMLQVYPERGPAVATFLSSEPRGPEPTGKSYLWSLFAKWFPDSRGDGALGAIWADPRLRHALLARMNALNARRWFSAVAT